jgi:hypothetical protein
MLATYFGFSRHPTDQAPGQAVLWWTLQEYPSWAVGTCAGTSTAVGVSGSTSAERLLVVVVDARGLRVPYDRRGAVTPVDVRTTSGTPVVESETLEGETTGFEWTAFEWTAFE